MGIKTSITNKDALLRIIDLKAGDCFIFTKGNSEIVDEFHYLEKDFEDNELCDVLIDIRDKDNYYDTILDSFYIFLVTKEYSIEHPFIEIVNITTMTRCLLSDDNSIYYTDIKKVKRTSPTSQSAHLMICHPSEIRLGDKFLFITPNVISICTCFDDGRQYQSDYSTPAKRLRFFNEHFSILEWNSKSIVENIHFIKILDCPETTVQFALS